MKDAIVTLRNAWNENPLELIWYTVFCLSLFSGLYGLLWLGSVLGMN